MEKEKFYITTAIAYTSRKPHIGNTYEVVLTDAIARFMRSMGRDVFFLTGTDEHGQKIEDIAREQGVTPKEYVDGVAGEIKNIWDMMNSSYDKFIRTTDDYHVESVQKIFKKLYDQGDIYKGEYKGWYCVPCESFFTDTQIENGVCPDCGRPVKQANEEAYFFRMSKYQDALMRHIEENPDFIQPESRKREMVNNFLKPGLQDLCVSRSSFKWGVPVTFDDKHVIYVWIDALSNYITALGYSPDSESELYKKYWPADVHIIGKDILRFHTIYWPIMLMALGEPLPKKVFGHPWLLFGSDKMSKSKGNVIYADDLVRHFGVDAVRYYVLREMPFAQDGTITYETIIARFNADLANTLGNLVNRTVAMANKYFGGAVSYKNVCADCDAELRDTAISARKTVEEKMMEYRVADALEEIISLARRSNKYIDETEPWALAKDEEKRDRLETVLFNLLESIRFIGTLLAPFMPETADKIMAQIGSDKCEISDLTVFAESGDKKVGVAEPLFARIDEAKKLEELAAENEPPKKEVAPYKDEIKFDDFEKIDLRVAKVVECEPVKKSDKLLRLMVDTGEATRQIVSGIAKEYKPEELIGKKVILVSNLAPAKLRGVESNGMLLAADMPDGGCKVIFIDDSVEEGSQIH
ncbi:MAG: methionine--tRNA ligase [Ruminococcaceae bacterium]|nr:methionine--tRNA ligase [Oscillospiraceae bacterium]